MLVRINILCTCVCLTVTMPILIGSKWISESMESTSSVKHCVPMVFYTRNVWKPKGAGKGLIGLQVCLVEQNDSLVQVQLHMKK